MYHVNNRETLLPKFIIVFSTVIWLLTETLSGLHALTSNNIRTIWAVIGIICLGSLISSLKRFGIVVKTTSGQIRKYISEITRGGQWLEFILISAFFVLDSEYFRRILPYQYSKTVILFIFYRIFYLAHMFAFQK